MQYVLVTTLNRKKTARCRNQEAPLPDLDNFTPGLGTSAVEQSTGWR